ncbi:solute carrier organic anion transporter family member 1A2 isoform X1 [Pogona vitticeps]
MLQSFYPEEGPGPVKFEDKNRLAVNEHIIQDAVTDANPKEESAADSKGDMRGAKKRTVSCYMSKLKVFLVALFFAYLAKTMSGAYMNSMLTQIERRFNIPASLVGVINGSFEIGNLLVIAFVSYLGSKLHRPRMIALGCAVMGLGCFLISLPHFLMGRYQYENTASLVENSSSSSMALCLANQSQFSLASEQPLEECNKQAGSLMWVFVMVGNIIRGVGETPITPLGISFVEDFARSENSPFYIGCLQIATVLGPLLGLMIGSYCAQLYVDFGFIDLEEVTLSLTDARWVGAWWLGVLICAAVNFLVAVPFCFVPKSLPKEGEEKSTDISPKGTTSFLATENTSHAKVNVREIAKDFIPYLKSLVHNPIYMLFLCITVIQFNAYIGMITFMPKYLEQQYGISASDAIFSIAVYNLPVICAGYFFGSLMMKKFKISTYKAAHIGFWSSVTEYLLYFTAFFLVCKNASVAGLTVSYEGIDQLSYVETTLYTDCNRGCNCSTKLWDPVCGDNGIAYVSACLAGCEVSNGTGKHTALRNCSCIASPGFPFGNGSAIPGQCSREESCGTMLHYYLILSLVCCLIYSFGAMPGYMVLIRSLKPEEKSFGVGLHSLVERVFAGIPSPIYYGAMIDTTCLKWGTKSCGGEGACRMYDSDMYRLLYLGLSSVLRAISYIPCAFVLLILRKQNRNRTNENIELEAKEENGTVEQKDMPEAQNATHLQQETIEMKDCRNTDL